MRIAFVILIGIHSIIHLFGFLKAFGMMEFNGIHQAIPKSHGLICLFAFFLFVLSLVLFLMKSHDWIVCGFLAVIVSQFLVLNYWSDASYATWINAIVLLVLGVFFMDNRFTKTIQEERMALFHKAKLVDEKILGNDDISHLPTVIQKWLTSSGVLGKPKVSTVYLTQAVQLKLKPSQTKWKKGIAEQYFTIDPPAFHWDIKTEMNPVLPIVGRDKFEEAKGEMLIKLLAIFPVADAKNNKKTNEASLQRYLAEMVWFPSAVLSPYIKWEAIDDYTAKATMEYKGTIGSGLFHFDQNGLFKKFVCMRYKDANDTEATQWIVNAIKNEKRNGVVIPVACEAAWLLDDEKWTWLSLEIKEIEYDIEHVKTMPNASSDEM
jgi:hypothetical protein